MRDGVVLKADLYRPDNNEKLPVLLMIARPLRQEISADLRPSLSTRCARHSAATTWSSLIAGDASPPPGKFNCFTDELQDGYDTIENVARQPWANGSVGTFGASYMGATQWLAATQTPPSLKAMVPSITASDYHDGWTYQGGAFALFFNVSWLMLSLAPADLMRDRADNPKADAELDALMSTIDTMRERTDFLPLKEFPLFQQGAPYFFDWLDHPYYDDYWKSLSIEERHDKINVPALNIAGWYDIFQGGSIRNYSGMKAKGPTPRAQPASIRRAVVPFAASESLVGQVDMGFRASPVSSISTGCSSISSTIG